MAQKYTMCGISRIAGDFFRRGVYLDHTVKFLFTPPLRRLLDPKVGSKLTPLFQIF